MAIEGPNIVNPFQDGSTTTLVDASNNQQLIAAADMSRTSDALQSGLNGASNRESASSSELHEPPPKVVMDDKGNKLTLRKDGTVAQKASLYPDGKKNHEVNYDTKQRPVSEFTYEKDGKTNQSVTFYKEGKKVSETQYKKGEPSIETKYKEGKIDEKIEYGLAMTHKEKLKKDTIVEIKVDEKNEYGHARTHKEMLKKGTIVEIKEPYFQTTKYDSSGSMTSLEKTFVVSSDKYTVDNREKNLKPRAQDGMISHTEIFDKKGNIVKTKEDFVYGDSKDSSRNGVVINSQEAVLSYYTEVKEFNSKGEALKTSIYEPLSGGRGVLSKEYNEQTGDSCLYKYNAEGKLKSKIERDPQKKFGKEYYAILGKNDNDVKWKFAGETF